MIWPWAHVWRHVKAAFLQKTNYTVKRQHFAIKMEAAWKVWMLIKMNKSSQILNIWIPCTPLWHDNYFWIILNPTLGGLNDKCKYIEFWFYSNLPVEILLPWCWVHFRETPYSNSTCQKYVFVSLLNVSLLNVNVHNFQKAEPCFIKDAFNDIMTNGRKLS